MIERRTCIDNSRFVIRTLLNVNLWELGGFGHICSALRCYWYHGGGGSLSIFNLRYLQNVFQVNGQLNSNLSKSTSLKLVKY